VQKRVKPSADCFFRNAGTIQLNGDPLYENCMNQALDLIRQLSGERFYGALTLRFEAGKITTIKKEQTIKPTDLSGTTEEQH